MTSDPVEVDDARGDDRAEETWTARDRTALDDRTSRVGAPPARRDELALEVLLETARDELRTANAEVRRQRDQLEDLLALRRASSLQRRRVALLLPVPTLSTDRSGRIDDANAAASVRLDVPLVRLLGKPLQAFVHEADRATVDRALSEVTPEPVRVQVRLAPRRSEPVAVDLVVMAELDGLHTSVRWSVVTPGEDGPGGGPGADPLRLAAGVAEISRLTAGRTDLLVLIGGVARVTRAALDTSTSVSANLGRPSEPTLVASTGDEAAHADGLQVRTGEGPCVDAYDEGETVLAADLRSDARWTRLAAALRDEPVRSALAVPVVSGGRRVGVLGCYSTGREAFDEPHARTAEVLALAAGAALEVEQETARLREVAQQLDQALRSRAVIDQAKGIVMARRGCTPDEAFTHLATLSQRRNVKLRDVARALVEQTAASGRRRL